MNARTTYLAVALGASALAASANDSTTTNESSAIDSTIRPTPMTSSGDEAAIRALEDRFVVAFNQGNVDAMMKNYVPDDSLVVFDIVPPREHLGADAYRKAWVAFFAHFKGTPTIAITDLDVTADGVLGFSHSIQTVAGTDLSDHPIDRTVRVTDGYRKIGNTWLITLEHISVPVDLKTGKADLSSKP